MMKLELLSSQILLAIGIVILLSQVESIYAARRPPLATTTPRPRTGRATVATNGITTAGLPTIGTVGEPSQGTTTPQPPAETAMVTTNRIKPTDHTTGSPTIIGTVEQPSPATATSRSPAGTAEIITDAVTTPNEEVNVTGTTESPMTITPVEINNTNAATSDSEGANIMNTTPTISTEVTPFETNSTNAATSDEGDNIMSTTTPFEANSTESDDLNITTTARSPAVTAETTPEEINSTVTDVTATDEFVKASTDTPTIISSDEVREITTLSDTTSESQGSTPIQPVLTGITFTGLIIAITLAGATLLIICVIASVTIVVRIRRQKIQDRREINERDFVTVYNYVPRSEFNITRNAAYRTGQHGYSSSPSIRGGAVLTRTNRPKPLLPPRRYARLNNQQMEVSIDSQGYVRLPRPFV